MRATLKDLCAKSESASTGGESVGFVVEGTFRTLIAVLPEEEASHEIPNCLPHLQYQITQRNHLHHQRAPHASFVKAESRKGWLWYRPCISLHLSSAGDEESGLHRDIMEWAEQLAPVNPAYRHHQTGEDNGDAHLKNLRLASPGRPAHHQR